MLGMVPSTSPLAGFLTGMVLPDSASAQAPST